MKSKKIILITVASILIISSFGIYNYLDIKFKSKKEGLTNSLSVQITRTRLKLKKNKIQKNNFYNTNLILKKFTSNRLKSTGPRSYLNYYNQNLFLITGTGILMFAPLNKIKNEKFYFKIINTNFNDLVGEDYINSERSVVKNLLIKNNKIYVSYIKKTNNECFANSILVSNLNFKKIIFNEFFNINECQPFFDQQVGGNLSDYKDNKILMTIGDYLSYERQHNNNPQNMKSLIGKIISIDEKTKEYKILSLGHRNAQGLYYDKDNNIIYFTEHGPQGTMK